MPEFKPLPTGEATPFGPKPPDFQSRPNFRNTAPVDPNFVPRSTTSLELQRYLGELIGQGGVGLSPEQLDVQFRGIEQQLQPAFNAQLQRIDEQAARRGVFRSGIPLGQAQQTQLKQSQQLGQIRTNLDIQNEKMRNQSLLTALQMLQNLESDIANRELYMKALQDLKDAQNQQGFQDLLGVGLSFGLDYLLPGAGTGARATGLLPGGSNTPSLPTGGF